MMMVMMSSLVAWSSMPILVVINNNIEVCADVLKSHVWLRGSGVAAVNVPPRKGMDSDLLRI